MAYIKMPPSDKTLDPREEERAGVQTPVELRRFGHFSWEFRGVITDLSSAGIGVDVPAILTVGQVVEMRFMNSDSMVTHRVRIVYRNNERHYGMQFLDAEMRLNGTIRDSRNLKRDGAAPGSA